ncbi:MULTISPECIES: DUF5994 family protein [Streptomyces]|uniref:Uncharacterized protein n=1 Tax=Streptomyces alboflavus TaxID=67267 RepID=A0A1Z1WFS1_9ACTN|nr:DUF5994 family protein [Streptomyces alboflavus]ARX85281.1 hypothetical protein SMD44_04740 [Streptomyces alboflavus]
METTPRRDGTFDGAWWPRSRDLEGQLPDLIRALTERLGPLARIGLDASAWDVHTRHVIVDGHMVRIDWSAVDDNTMLITRGRQDIFSFLMLPPQTDATAARAAMAMAVQDGNGASAAEILAVTGITSA